MIEIIFLVIFGVFSLVVAGSLVWLYLARKREMLLARSVATMLVQSVSTEMLVAMICFREYDRENFPCVLYIMAMTLFIPMQFLPIFWRASRLHFRTNYTFAAESTMSYHNNLLRRRGIMFVITAVVLAISIAVMGVQIFVASQSAEVTKACAWNSEYEFIVLAVEAGLYSITFGALLFKLQRVEDPLLLARELRITFAWTLVWTVTFLVFNLVPGLWYLDSVFPFSSFILVMVVGLHFISVLWPLYLSRKRIYRKVASSLIAKNSADYYKIRPYLINDVAMQQLYEFCITSQNEMAASAESAFEDLSPVKKPHTALSIFVDTYHYMVPQNVRDPDVAKRIHQFVTRSLPLEYRQAITPDDSIAMMEGALTSGGVPTPLQMKPYYLPLAAFVEVCCVVPFTQTDAYAHMMVGIRKLAYQGVRMNIEFNEGEAASLVFADSLDCT